MYTETDTIDNNIFLGIFCESICGNITNLRMSIVPINFLQERSSVNLTCNFFTYVNQTRIFWYKERFQKVYWIMIDKTCRPKLYKNGKPENLVGHDIKCSAEEKHITLSIRNATRENDGDKYSCYDVHQIGNSNCVEIKLFSKYPFLNDVYFKVFFKSVKTLYKLVCLWLLTVSHVFLKIIQGNL